MKPFDFKTASYSVSGYPEFTFTEALQLWRAKFETINHFKRDVLKHSRLAEMGAFIEEVWDGIEPVTVSKALRETNVEKRRVLFDCIGVTKLFKELQPVPLDQQVIAKSRTRWTPQNQPYSVQYDDTYELYQIDGSKLFEHDPLAGQPNDVYAVRCWCTTTNREYWIYVPQEAALGRQSIFSKNKNEPDAVRAIAWTIRIDLINPTRIYRQGDIIVAEASATSETVTPYHLTKEHYLELMYSET